MDGGAAVHNGAAAHNGGADSNGTASNGGSDAQASAKTKTAWSARKKLIVGLASALAVVLVIVGVGIALYLSNLDNTIRIDEPERLEALEAALTVPETSDEPYYALLLGSDSRDTSDSYAGLSDTIMLVRVDPKVPQVSVLSVPRDTEIIFGDYGNIKINAAFTYEQEAGAVKAVEQLCAVQIAHFAEIDFTGVETLVDRLGGVDVTVPVSFELDGLVFEEGPQHLDGYQALLFSRARSFPLGDFQRVVDQRILLQAVAKKVLAAPKEQLPALVQSLADCIRTDVTVAEAAGLLTKLSGMPQENLHMGTIPTTTNGHDGVSYVAVVEPEFSQVMERFRSGLPPIDPAAPPDVSSQTGVVQP
jgi:LCP family protein required for cell wall assembly